MTAPLEPTQPDATTNAPSPSTPPTGAAEPQPWRAGPNADPRLQGKTAEEILGIAGALLTVAERFNQPIPQPQPQAQPNRFDLDVPDDEYVQGKDVKRIWAQVASQPPMDPIARQQSAGALYLAAKQAYADDFRRWEGEIRNELGKLPIEYWNLDNVVQIVKIVRSNHVDELAAEKAQRIANESHPTIRSGTGGSGSGPLATTDGLEADGIPADWRKKVQAMGISEREIREFCQAAGISEAEYYRDLVKYGKGSVIHG